MLTRKQHELLSFIDSHLKETGVSPSFEEMKEALSLRSKSGIHRLISALEERGFLRRHHHRARALEVVKLPENMAHQALPTRREGAKPAPAAPGFSPNVIRGDFSAPAAGRARGTGCGGHLHAALRPHRRRPGDRGAAR